MYWGTPAFRALVVGLTSALLIGVPGLAFAASPLAGAPEVLLAFGQRYATDTGDSTHSGIDLAGSAGDDVCAPAEGTVAFAGRIPAGTGSTVLACTIQLVDGSKVTLMPLERVSVRSGQCVASGDALGTLAAVGDRSSGATHLHVSLRTGGLYVDPASLIAPVAAAVPDPPAASDPVPVPVPAPAVAPAVPCAPVAGGSPAAASPVAPSAAVPAGMASGVSLAPAAGAPARLQAPAIAPSAAAQRSAPVAPRAGAAGPRVEAAEPPLTLANGEARGVAARSGRGPRSASTAEAHQAVLPLWSWAALAGAGFSAIALLSARARRPRFEALLSDVTPVRDHVAAAVDRC